MILSVRSLTSRGTSLACANVAFFMDCEIGFLGEEFGTRVGKSFEAPPMAPVNGFVEVILGVYVVATVSKG